MRWVFCDTRTQLDISGMRHAQGTNRGTMWPNGCQELKFRASCNNFHFFPACGCGPPTSRWLGESVPPCTVGTYHAMLDVSVFSCPSRVPAGVPGHPGTNSNLAQPAGSMFSIKRAFLICLMTSRPIKVVDQGLDYMQMLLSCALITCSMDPYSPGSSP